MSNKKSLTHEEALSELQVMHFVTNYCFESLFLTVFHLFVGLILLTILWLFSLSPSDILSFYTDKVIPSVFGKSFSIILSLSGAAPLAIFLLYIRYSKKVYRKTLLKRFQKKGSEAYQKELEKYSS